MEIGDQQELALTIDRRRGLAQRWMSIKIREEEEEEEE
jgi:hypothetical protein